MSEVRPEVLLLVVGDGEFDVGRPTQDPIPNADQPALPALPCLVHRLLDSQPNIRFRTEMLRNIRTNQTGGAGPKWGKKVKAAVLRARQSGAKGVAIVADRDGTGQERLRQMEAARDALDSTAWVPCALGLAIETFDAWMIADAHALREAGAIAAAPHPNPEGLDGREASGRHPKDYAATQFGQQSGLGEKYADIAAALDIAALERACPRGFGAFAREVRQHLQPVVASTGGSQ